MILARHKDVTRHQWSLRVSKQIQGFVSQKRFIIFVYGSVCACGAAKTPVFLC